MRSLSQYPLAKALPSHLKVPLLAWQRPDRKQNIIMRKEGFISAFSDLHESVSALVQTAEKNRTQLRAVRYQNYFVHCHVSNMMVNVEERQALDTLRVPVLFTTKLDENAGYMSSDVWPKTCGNTFNYDRTMNRCVEKRFLNDTLARCGRTYDDMRRFLGHPNVLLQLVSQHQSFDHPKVLSLPLGIVGGKAKRVAQALTLISVMRQEGRAPKRSKLVLVNNSGWNYRQDVNAYFKRVFGEDNAYRLGAHAPPQEDLPPGYNAEVVFIMELASSKFVVCPPGLGFDTYRLWQALLMGAVPIVESSPGFDRTYSLLPVLVVPSLLDVTPAFLESAYPCFIEHAAQWRYDMLTQQYWDVLIATALSTASIDHIARAHPPVNPYCNFMHRHRT